MSAWYEVKYIDESGLPAGTVVAPDPEAAAKSLPGAILEALEDHTFTVEVRTTGGVPRSFEIHAQYRGQEPEDPINPAPLVDMWDLSVRELT